VNATVTPSAAIVSPDHDSTPSAAPNPISPPTMLTTRLSVSTQREDALRRKTERLQDGMFAHPILHGHDGRRRHQCQHQPDTGVTEIARETDQFDEVAHGVGLEDALRPGVGQNRTAATSEVGVDLAADGEGVGPFREMNLELRHGSDGVDAPRPLKEVKMEIEEVLLGGRGGLVDARDGNRHLADG